MAREHNALNNRDDVDSRINLDDLDSRDKELTAQLRRDGHGVSPLDYHVGDGILDRFIDLPPYAHDLAHLADQKWLPAPSHLKLAIDGFASTCFGLIVRKAM